MPDANPKLMTIFGEALERSDQAERAAYLAKACGDDQALRDRVEVLLAAHDEAGRFLEPESQVDSETIIPETVGALAASVPETDPASQSVTGHHPANGPITTIADASAADTIRRFVPGQVVAGRYTLLDILGEGGMGTVYRAKQTEPVKRQVALKLIKIGMDSRAVLARFDAERQALALMDHPNIARVYDGGTTEAGQPFFVMELVSGLPITEYCDRERLSVRARLELFVSVCQAVQHAHQKGIIHRDLKPGNVLVTEVDGRPMPKVIDFGVAKATEFKLTDQSLADSGAIVGTPAYMSPEQADPSSMDIDTRTDVYALGVILYELLAGSPPIDAKQFHRGAILEMLRMVREVDPPRPSTKVSTAAALPNIAASRAIEPEQLKRALHGDLDWIVMKAIEKDRSRRYETANGFAADVLRHLASEPVLAAPPSQAYRLRKFVRKHRGSVVAASLVVLALVGGIVGTSWGLIRAERSRAAEAKRVEERDEALDKADKARRTADARAEDLKYQLGVSDFLLANAAYDNGNGDVRLTAERLEKVPEEQRRWEWHYLKRLSRGGLFTLYGHTDSVMSVSFSRDGASIVTGSSDGTAKVWDSRTGALTLDLRGHMGSVYCASFNPDGTRIVTGSWDDSAKVWDSRTGARLLDLRVHTSAVHSASFSPDGKRVITSGGSKNMPGLAEVWDAQTGTLLFRLRGHAGDINQASFSPDGTRIVTGGDDKVVRLWDGLTGSLLLEMKGHNSSVSSAAFSPDGSRLITGSSGDTAKVWDARIGKLSVELKDANAVRKATFSPDGTRIVTVSSDFTAKVWEARTGIGLHELRGHTSGVYDAAFSPDGMRIVTASEDKTAKVWDAQTPTPGVQLNGHTGSLTSISFSPDGMHVVTSSGDRTAKVWCVRTGSPLRNLKGHSNVVSSASFSPDGTRIVTASWDKTAKVWDVRTGAVIHELKADLYQVNAASFSPDGSRIVTAGGAGTAKIWDASTGALLLELKGHVGGVQSASFSPDGTRVVTGGWDDTAKVWDARTGVHLLDLKGHAGPVYTASFSPDGVEIVTASFDYTAKLWDARTGMAIIELRGHTHKLFSASFSPDGKRVVTGGIDTTAKVWDVRTGLPLLDLKGHTSKVRGGCFSPDGRRIVTCSSDNTAKVWDAGPTTPPLKLTGNAARVLSVSFSQDGTRIVTTSQDKSARVWNAHTGAPLLELKGHQGWVRSASFSPDDSRVVTISFDQTAKVWDARTGTTLLDLRGQTGWATDVSFSTDGRQIVTSSDETPAKVWDATTGEELKDARLPATLARGHSDPRRRWVGLAIGNHVSPDRRSVALMIGNHVELIPAQPNEEELASRRALMRPNFRLYREAYDAAIKANDAFAAKFYLNLFPPPERALIQADTEIQAACLKLVGTWPEPADQYNALAWDVVRTPGRLEAEYRLGLSLANVACRLEPDNVAYFNTLGLAQFRCGLMTEALATLTRSNEKNGQKEPSDLTFLALCYHRLGQPNKASDTLARLRTVMKDQQHSEDAEARAFLHEAETIELDRGFPTDPFAR
jgi:WD40 repeat protein/serine/threonine protein kinase